MQPTRLPVLPEGRAETSLRREMGPWMATSR
jgi:hypothetical protein